MNKKFPLIVIISLITTAHICGMSPSQQPQENERIIAQFQFTSPVRKKSVADTFKYAVGFQGAECAQPLPDSPMRAGQNLLNKAKARVDRLKKELINNGHSHKKLSTLRSALSDLGLKTPERNVNKNNKSSAQVLDEALSCAAAVHQLLQKTDKYPHALNDAIPTTVRQVRDAAKSLDFFKPIDETKTITSLFEKEAQKIEREKKEALEAQDWQECDALYSEINAPVAPIVAPPAPAFAPLAAIVAPAVAAVANPAPAVPQSSQGILAPIANRANNHAGQKRKADDQSKSERKPKSKQWTAQSEKRKKQKIEKENRKAAVGTKTLNSFFQ